MPRTTEGLDVETLRRRLAWLRQRRDRTLADIAHYKERLEAIKLELTDTEIALIRLVGPPRIDLGAPR